MSFSVLCYMLDRTLVPARATLSCLHSSELEARAAGFHICANSALSATSVWSDKDWQTSVVASLGAYVRLASMAAATGGISAARIHDVTAYFSRLVNLIPAHHYLDAEEAITLRFMRKGERASTKAAFKKQHRCAQPAAVSLSAPGAEDQEPHGDFAEPWCHVNLVGRRSYFGAAQQ